MIVLCLFASVFWKVDMMITVSEVNNKHFQICVYNFIIKLISVRYSHNFRNIFTCFIIYSYLMDLLQCMVL